MDNKSPTLIDSSTISHFTPPRQARARCPYFPSAPDPNSKTALQRTATAIMKDKIMIANMVILLLIISLFSQMIPQVNSKIIVIMSRKVRNVSNSLESNSFSFCHLRSFGVYL